MTEVTTSARFCGVVPASFVSSRRQTVPVGECRHLDSAARRIPGFCKAFFAAVAAVAAPNRACNHRSRCLAGFGTARNWKPPPFGPLTNRKIGPVKARQTLKISRELLMQRAAIYPANLSASRACDIWQASSDQDRRVRFRAAFWNVQKLCLGARKRRRSTKPSCDLERFGALRFRSSNFSNISSRALRVKPFEPALARVAKESVWIVTRSATLNGGMSLPLTRNLM